MTDRQARMISLSILFLGSSIMTVSRGDMQVAGLLVGTASLVWWFVEVLKSKRS